MACRNKNGHKEDGNMKKATKKNEQNKDSTMQNSSPQFFIEAPHLQNGVDFYKEQYSSTASQ